MKAPYGTVFYALLVLACGQPAAPDAGPPEAPPPEPGSEENGEPEAAADCGRLGELACLRSAECTLILEGEPQGGYRCRAAEGPCETGFRQKGDGPEACEAKEGCTFVPGQCYCSPDVTCICGGGPPPQCTDAAAAEGRTGGGRQRETVKDSNRP